MIDANIKHYRKRFGYTQAEIAKLMRISIQQLQKYENGKTNITTARIKQFAEIFNIEPAELFIMQVAEKTQPHNMFPSIDEDFFEIKDAFYKIKNPILRKKAIAAVKIIASEDYS